MWTAQDGGRALSTPPGVLGPGPSSLTVKSHLSDLDFQMGEGLSEA